MQTKYAEIEKAMEFLYDLIINQELKSGYLLIDESMSIINSNGFDLETLNNIEIILQETGDSLFEEIIENYTENEDTMLVVVKPIYTTGDATYGYWDFEQDKYAKNLNDGMIVHSKACKALKVLREGKTGNVS